MLYTSFHSIAESRAIKSNVGVVRQAVEPTAAPVKPATDDDDDDDLFGFGKFTWKFSSYKFPSNFEFWANFSKLI